MIIVIFTAILGLPAMFENRISQHLPVVAAEALPNASGFMACPGSRTAPLLPPLSASARLSSRKPARCFSGPWQATQARVSIGLMSRW